MFEKGWTLKYNWEQTQKHYTLAILLCTSVQPLTDANI